jgi:hypothetical protein
VRLQLTIIDDDGTEVLHKDVVAAPEKLAIVLDATRQRLMHVVVENRLASSGELGG